MADTIESFVAKLQEEGVEAGRQAAEKIRADAQQQAEKALQDARQQAQKIVSDAQAQADNLLARSKSELDLAARDVVLRLQKALGRAMRALIAYELKDALPNVDFLSQTLHDLVLLYAKADIAGDRLMKINVSPELQGQLADWAIRQMAHEAGQVGLRIDLKGTLETAGFEYQISGGTVEVTLDSVVESVSELVGPRLREVIEQAVGNLGNDKPTFPPRQNREDPR